MRVSIILFLAMLYAATVNAQTCPCSGLSLSGTSFDSGTPGYDQNSSNDFCIADGDTYTGSLPNTTGGSLTICGIWAPSSSVNLSINGDFTITNNGSLNMGNNDFKYSGNGDVFVNNGDITSSATFEIDEATFINNDQLTAENIYLHGVVTNNATGVMESTATNCNGMPNNSCGFFVGDKGQIFVNDGAFIAVDFLSRPPVTGSGTVDASNSIQLRGEYGMSTTSNVFTAPTITLIESNNTSSGTYFATTFNCDINNFSASACNLDGTATHDLNDGGIDGTDCQAGATNNSTCLAVLPVELISFNLVERNEYLIFNWESGEEINFSHYELQESEDNFNFKSIVTVEGQGRNSIYQSSRVERKDGIRYYRLKVIDLDNSAEYYDKILSSSMSEHSVNVEIYPNPISGTDKIYIKNLKGNPTILSLYDMDGRKLMTRAITDKYESYLDLNQLDLSTGSYVVEVIMENKIFTEKLVIVE